MTDLDEVRKQFLELQLQAATLATDALHLRPSWRRVFSRKRLRHLEKRVDALFKTFMKVDEQLSEHASISPRDVNTSLILTTRLMMDFRLRDSVRGLLSDTNSLLGGIRSHLDFKGSLLLSVAAVVIASVSAFVDVSTLVGGR